MEEIKDRQERSESRGVNILKKTPEGVFKMAGTTRLELATSCVTGMRSNQTELRSHKLVTSLLYLLKKKLQ